MPKTFKFDKYVRESKRTAFTLEGPFPDEPYVERGLEAPDQIVIPVPTGAVYWRAETAGGSRGTLEVLAGPSWPLLEPLLGDADAGIAMDILRDAMRHFGLGDEDRPPGGGRR